MMFDTSIRRRLTSDLADERESERYDQLRCQVEDAERKEWGREFPGRPFNPDGRRIHEAVMKVM